VKSFVSLCWLWTALAAGAEPVASSGNIRDIEPDLAIPDVTIGEPAAGKRVRAVTAGWQRTEASHVLYLPNDWRPGKSYPVLVEYPGNGGYQNELGDTSDGTPESCMLGFGLSGGNGFLWLSLPFVEVTADGSKRNCLQWWGDIDETKRYCTATVQSICERYGGDPSRVVLCGFSRGAIACNYLGLHDDKIAALWCGFFCHSHYDSDVNVSQPDFDPKAAVARLGRLGGRPQWISHEEEVSRVQGFIERHGVTGSFKLVASPYPNHSSAWILRDNPERAQAREWLWNATKP